MVMPPREAASWKLEDSIEIFTLMGSLGLLLVLLFGALF